MDSKWYYAAVVVFVLGMFGALAAESYTKGQCRETGIKAGKSADDIEKICR